MKTLIFSILFSIAFIFNHNAQLTEGKITYSIYMDSDDDETNNAEDVIAQSTLELFFSGNKTKSLVNSGDDLTMATIIDSDSKTGLLIMTGLMGNLAITANYDQIIGEKSAENDGELELLDQTKTIAGYNCKKARLYKKDGSKITYWYTENIKLNSIGVENHTSELNGTPLKITIETDDVLMTYEAQDIQEKLDDTPNRTFSTTPPTEGFTVISIEQFEAGDF